MKKSVWALSLLLTTFCRCHGSGRTVHRINPRPAAAAGGGRKVEKTGYDVETNIIPQAQLEKMMLDSGATANLMSCHLATLNGKYVIGHVPADSWMPSLIRCRKVPKGNFCSGDAGRQPGYGIHG